MSFLANRQSEFLMILETPSETVVSVVKRASESPGVLSFREMEAQLWDLNVKVIHYRHKLGPIRVTHRRF